MNREQIIKALECHAERSLDTCKKCPFLNIDGCSYKLASDAFSLIKGLTEENERMKDELADAEAEAEKAIDIAEDNIRAEIASGGTSCHWCEDIVRADTVRKMQDMIKERCIKVGIYPAFVARAIEEVAKELIGDELH